MMTLTCEADEVFALQSDRRRDIRAPHERDVRLHEPFSARSYDGMTLDLSSTGMRLQLSSDCRLRAGRIVSLHLGLNACGQSLANRRHNVPARVVWVSESEEGTIAGIELLAHVNATAA